MSKRSAEPEMGPSAKMAKLEDGVKEEEVLESAAQPEIIGPRRGIKYPLIWYKDQEPLNGLQQIFDSSTEGDKIAEVIIPSEYMNSNNRRVKTRQIWGDKIYTGDSDIVAVLMHLGYFAYYLSHPPSQVQEFRALLRLLPPQEKYPPKARFVKSRAWCSTIQGCSYQVECCWLTTRAGTTIDLQPSIDEVPAPYPTVHTNFNRTINTRSTGRQGGKVSQEVSIQYNLCNEPWLKYTLPAIADRGLKPNLWTSAKMLENVLFLETASYRYQIARTGEQAADTAPGQAKDLYSLSKCKLPLPMGLMLKAGLPLYSPEHVEVLEECLGWEDLKWGVSTLNIRGRELQLKRMHFMPIKSKDQIV